MSAQIIPLQADRRRIARISLSDQDCFSLASEMRILPGGWYAQRDEDDEGVVSMTLFATEEEEVPAFQVRRDPAGLRLEDGETPVGRFSTVRELLWAARRRLET